MFGLMEIAKEQQQAVNTALVDWAKSKDELASVAAILLEYGKRLVVNASKAAGDGAIQVVKAALANASQMATETRQKNLASHC